MTGSKFRMVVLQGYLIAQQTKPRRLRNWDKLLEWCEARLTDGGPAPQPPAPLPQLDSIRVSAKLQQDLNSQGLTHEEVDWQAVAYELAEKGGLRPLYVEGIVIPKHRREKPNDQHLRVKPELLLWLVERVR